MKAIDRFDPGRGTRSRRFAVPTILGELKRHFRDRGWPSRSRARSRNRTLAAETRDRAAGRDHGREPTVAELGEALGLTAEEVIEAEAASSAYRTDSLDAPGDEDGAPLVDLLGADDEQFARVEERTTLAVSLARAAAGASSQVLRLRFVRGPHAARDRRADRLLADARVAAAPGGDRHPAARLTERSGVVTGPVPAGDFPQGVQLLVAVGVGVLHSPPWIRTRRARVTASRTGRRRASRRSRAPPCRTQRSAGAAPR